MSDLLERSVKPRVRALKYDRLYRKALRDAASHPSNGAGHRGQPYVFIVGCGRSGTSILGTLLAMHPEVAYVREPYHLWAAVDPRTDATNLYVRGDGRCLMTGELVDDGVRARFASLFGGDDARFVIEKTPHNALRIGYLEALTPAGRFIHIVRDGCEVVRSIASLADANTYRIAGRPRYNQWWGTDDAKWRNLMRDGAEAGYFADEVGLLRGHEQRAAYEWLVTLSEIDRWRASLDDRLVEVTYEALCADPSTELSRSAVSLELTPDEDWIAAASRLVRPAGGSARAEVRLPPRMTSAFNGFADRFGFPGHAAVG